MGEETGDGGESCGRRNILNYKLEYELLSAAES